MLKVCLGIAGVLAATVAGHPARATVITATFAGTVASGIDRYSTLFGQTGQPSDLTGLDFTAVFTIDDAVQSATYYYSSSGSSAFGGGITSTVSPISQVQLSINGSNTGVASTFLGFVSLGDGFPNGSGVDSLEYSAQNSFHFPGFSYNKLLDITVSDMADFITNADYRTPATYQLPSGTTDNSAFFFEEAGADTPTGPLKDFFISTRYCIPRR